MMKNNDFDGIIFDVDGTLWDSTFVVKDAWNAAIVEAGFPNPEITADRLKGLFGLPMDDIIRDLMPELDQAQRDNLAPFVFKYEHDYLEERSGLLYDKIIEVMRDISKKIPVYIVSNCQGGYIELFMRKNNIDDIVRDHLCPADLGLLKADNIRTLVKKYSMNSPLYVGDTIMDQKACIDAACPFCFAQYGFGKAENPEYVINSPSDLYGLLGID